MTANTSITDIQVGTLVKGDHADLVGYLEQILPYGFETIALTFWQQCDVAALPGVADRIRPVLDAYGARVSSLSLFGNLLEHDEMATASRQGWAGLIEYASAFDCDLVTGFTGRLRGTPVPDSIDRFQEVFAPLADTAGERGVRLAFENCPMRGDWRSGEWNLAFNPAAWALLFEAVPAANLGLQWEPCHQLLQFADPMLQLDDWHQRIFSIHGKDASIYHDRLARFGNAGPRPWGEHRHPGFGDSDWTAIISRLRSHGFRGAIEIEGWHDPVYRDELEIPGQVAALAYLKRCRGGPYQAVGEALPVG